MPASSSLRRRLTFAAVVFGLGFLTASCGSGSTSGPGDPSNPLTADPIDHLYAKTTTELPIEIDYQPGAEPYTETLLTGDPWKLFQANADALFNRQKNVTVPTTLPQMERLGDISGTEFTSQQILDIASRHRGMLSTTNSTSFYIVFLNGHFHDGKMVRKDVLGVSIGKTGVIAIFKPVIANAPALGPSSRPFIEQTTLIHEFGHAVGLVNNGVAMVTPHQDAAHGAHDSDSSCVMYYANEGASAVAEFVRNLRTGDEVLFDSQCLADVAARLE
jgi:hypothetical protein